MLHVTLRGLQGHVVRLVLTAFAVMLGVSFVTGTFVLRDTINNTLSGLTAQASKGVNPAWVTAAFKVATPKLKYLK